MRPAARLQWWLVYLMLGSIAVLSVLLVLLLTRVPAASKYDELSTSISDKRLQDRAEANQHLRKEELQ